MLVHRRVTPRTKFRGTHLLTWVERGTEGVKCLAQEHNKLTLASTQPWLLDREWSTLTIRPLLLHWLPVKTTVYFMTSAGWLLWLASIFIWFLKQKMAKSATYMYSKNNTKSYFSNNSCGCEILAVLLGWLVLTGTFCVLNSLTLYTFLMIYNECLLYLFIFLSQHYLMGK